MDFGDKGCTKIILCGRSNIDKNTIQIHFSGDKEDTKQLVNFTHSIDYDIREFPLEKIQGNQKVTFVFLPGCKFDFQWFQFH